MESLKISVQKVKKGVAFFRKIGDNILVD